MSSTSSFSPSIISSTCFGSSVILLAYNLYVSTFGVKKSAFRTHSITLHNAPGLMMAGLGTICAAITSDHIINSSPQTPMHILHDKYSWFQFMFGLWLLSFYVNTITGFFMIPLLPNVDPAVKREFISLVLLQLSFAPAVLGMINVSLAPVMELSCYVISTIGIIASSANLYLYVLDYMDGRSNKVCSGTYLVSSMDKQHQERKKRKQYGTMKQILDDYISICFVRGSENTRMPANGLMIFIAFTLVVPHPFIIGIASQLRKYHEIYPMWMMDAPALMAVLIFCTVGNMQVFHGTLAVRGKETVSRASWMVAVTVVLMVVLIFAIFIHVQGTEGFKDFMKCTLLSNCPSLLIVENLPY